MDCGIDRVHLEKQYTKVTPYCVIRVRNLKTISLVDKALLDEVINLRSTQVLSRSIFYCHLIISEKYGCPIPYHNLCSRSRGLQCEYGPWGSMGAAVQHRARR